MYKIIALTTTILFMLTPSILGQITVERVLPKDGYLPGVQFAVTIQLSPLDQDKQLVETPPKGWFIGHSNYTGVVQEGTITFKLLATKFTKPTKIIYLVTPPSDWKGEGVFTGNLDGQVISGMTTIAQGVPKPVGIFENHIDVDIVPPGDCTYDPQTGEYKITGGFSRYVQANGHFAYSEVSGAFSIQAKIRANTGPNIIIMDYLESESPYYSLWVETSGSANIFVSDGWVSTRNGGWASNFSVKATKDQLYKVMRQGDRIDILTTDPNTGEWKNLKTRNLPIFTDPVYVGIWAWGSPSTVGTFTSGYISEVELTKLTSSVESWELY